MGQANTVGPTSIEGSFSNTMFEDGATIHLWPISCLNFMIPGGLDLCPSALQCLLRRL